MQRKFLKLSAIQQRSHPRPYSFPIFLSAPYKVKELFEKVLAGHPDVIKEPPPRVLFNDLGESSLDFRLLFWTNNFDEWIRIRSEVIFGIHDILKSESMTIPFPQRDLHLRSVDQGIEFVRKESKD